MLFHCRFLLLLSVLLVATDLVADEPVDYLKDIKPLLQGRCYACHGGLQQKSGLRLDTVALAINGGDSGPAITRGDAANSPLLARVSATDIAERMPPESEGEALSASQIDLLRRWIAAGALAPPDEVPEADPRDHWAFRPIVRPLVHVTKHRDWQRNEVDALVAAKLEQHGLSPQREAPRELLIRRLYVDLIGLPPTLDELAVLQSDQAAGWYERLVERLLEDPRHGERWARHWMDIWRYSDWWGLGDQLRNSQKHIWHWRDWIIESLNADLPYDEMVRLMLAADELHPNDLDKLRASGYLARNYFLFNRHQWMDETVEHVSKGFLGLTINCAKCHDHKFDPLAQTDYYRLRAFFEPYHVRVDNVPGQVDLGQDGIPRAFDGLLADPTYRFIRGQESQPDKSQVMSPGVPRLLAFEELSIQPVTLPKESFQPERRDWVFAAYQAAAHHKRNTAEATAGSARNKLATALRTVEASPETAIAQAEYVIAERTLAVAQVEVNSLERRIAAMRASWAKSDGQPPDQAVLENAERDAARAAVRAERELAAANSKLAVANIELKLLRAAADKRAEVQKELAAAHDAVDQAVKHIDEPGEQYTRLTGAAWTPTRFFNSTKDDPTVTFPPTSSGRRTALAKWITDRRHPLTARVAANHIWMRHLGTPLVPTVFDFGRKGTPPANPELLDWLAAEFVEHGWSMKHLHRVIVLSAAYRLSSSLAGAEANVKIDPDNRFGWRRQPLRLESQVIRDAVLALAGRLDPTRGGPPVLSAQQATSNRRSLYFFHSNNERNLFLTTFDEAVVKDCYRREQSIVPQQALALANSGLILDAAPLIADRLSRPEKSAVIDDTQFIQRAFLLLLGISAGERELTASRQALDRWRAQPATSSEKTRANLVWVLLNHNDFVTLR